MAEHTHIKIKACEVNPGGNISAKDSFVWENKGASDVTITFDGDVPDLFGDNTTPPASITILAGSRVTKTLVANPKITASTSCHYSISGKDCHEAEIGVLGPGAHVIIVDP